MSSDRITRYVETQTRIAAKVEIGVWQPDSVHPGWTNFVSQKSVKAIAIAPKSQHIWLATWGGVLSWNRKEELLYRYSSESGLAGNSVSCLCVDRDENPWTGHAEGGLSYFNGRQWQIYSHLQTAPIRAIASAVSREGIWAATADTIYYIPHLECAPILVAKQSNGAVEALALLADGDDLLLGNAFGLFRLGLKREPEAIAPDTLDNCTTLTRDGNGDVWVGTTNGLYQLISEKSSQYFAREIIGSIGRTIALAAGKKRVWILTPEGLFQIINGQRTIVPWNSESEKLPTIQAIAVSTDDAYLWLGTDRLLAGVWSKNPEDTRWDLEELLPLHRDDALNNLGRCTVPQDSNERVWVGTAGGLVTFGAKNDWTIYAKNNDVRSLIAINSGENSTASESIWMVAQPQGIAQLIPPTRLNFPKLQLPGLPTLLSLGNDKSPYILTGRALWQLETGKLKEIAKAAPALPRCLLQTPDAVWWLGTVRGLYRLNADRWEFVGAQPGPLQTEIYALVVADNILWVASETGLWERRGDNWIAHHSEQTDASRAVWALAAGRSQTLWLASERGVCRYHPKTRTYSATYTPFNSGLSSRRVAALLETSDFLWIVTQVGISRLTLDEGGKISEF